MLYMYRVNEKYLKILLVFCTLAVKLNVLYQRKLKQVPQNLTRWSLIGYKSFKTICQDINLSYQHWRSKAFSPASTFFNN